jgi:hypothetical protein
MKIKVYVLDLEIPRRTKRIALVVGVPAALLLGVVAIAYASGLTTFSAGQELSSSSMNANFNYLQSEIASLQAFQTAATADGGYSVGGTFCGATAATEGSFSGPGTLTGYASARAQCQGVAACSATTGHMCTAEEIVRTRQLGGAITTTSTYGWYAGGLYIYWSTDQAFDCQGWTSNVATNVGPVWYPASNYPTGLGCSNSEQILCCN